MESKGIACTGPVGPEGSGCSATFLAFLWLWEGVAMATCKLHSMAPQTSHLPSLHPNVVFIANPLSHIPLKFTVNFAEASSSNFSIETAPSPGCSHQIERWYRTFLRALGALTFPVDGTGL